MLGMGRKMGLAIYEVFRDAGIEEKKARDIASTLNGAIEHHSQNLATQGDIERLRIETKFEIEKLRLETTAGLEQLRLETKAYIEKSKNDIIRWLIGTTLGGIAAAVAIARLFLTS